MKVNGRVPFWNACLTGPLTAFARGRTNEEQFVLRRLVRGLCKGGLTNLVRVETQQP
jgi:hypothetical protein